MQLDSTAARGMISRGTGTRLIRLLFSASDAVPLTLAQRKILANTALMLGVEGLDLVRVLNEVAQTLGFASFELVPGSHEAAFKQALNERKPEL